MVDCSFCPFSMQNEEASLRIDQEQPAADFEAMWRAAAAEVVRLRAVAVHERSIGAELWLSSIAAIRGEIEAIAMESGTPPEIRERLLRIAKRVEE